MSYSWSPLRHFMGVEAGGTLFNTPVKVKSASKLTPSPLKRQRFRRVWRQGTLQQSGLLSRVQRLMKPTAHVPLLKSFVNNNTTTPTAPRSHSHGNKHTHTTSSHSCRRVITYDTDDAEGDRERESPQKRREASTKEKGMVQSQIRFRRRRIRERRCAVPAQKRKFVAHYNPLWNSKYCAYKSGLKKSTCMTTNAATASCNDGVVKRIPNEQVDVMHAYG